MEHNRKKEKYNIVLITVDSLRADFLGIYNPSINEENNTPTLNAWAKKAIVFSRAITQSSHTSPAFLGILSGHYPSKYGDWFNVVSDDRPMMAEILKYHGYHTYGFNSNPYISHYYKFNRGFDLYKDNMPPMTGKKVKKASLILSNHIKAVLTEPYENAETINNQIMTHIREFKSPYFLWVHYMDVHGPYIPQKGWRTKNKLKSAYLWRKSLQNPEHISDKERSWLIQSYKDEISYLDYHLITLLNCIDHDNAIVILTADHGDLFGEHGLYGHTLRLYNPLLHVPLLIRHPEVKIVKNIKTPVRSIDILPTILEMLSLKNNHAFDGKSILPTLKHPDKVDNSPLISEVSRKHLCVEREGWKLIVDYKNNQKELYNLTEDLAEQRNLYESHGKIKEELEDIIQEHLKRNNPKNRSTKIEHNEEMKSRLRALGYMD